MPDVMDRLEVVSYENQPHLSKTYLIISSHSEKAVVVDPGEAQSIAGLLRERNLAIEFITLTHEHFDHIAGVEALRTTFRCPVICARECSKALTDPKLNLSRYWENQDEIHGEEADVLMDANLSWVWGGETAHFFSTPGHSPGSLCIAIGNNLFTGDALLPGAKRVTHFPGGDRQLWEKSLQFIFSSFPAETIVYPGHGEPFPLGELPGFAVAPNRIFGPEGRCQ